MQIFFLMILSVMVIFHPVHANEKLPLNHDLNVSDIKYTETSTPSTIPNKIKSFFYGIVDDVKEFAIDNKIIENTP